MIGFETALELELVITFSTPSGSPASSRICATASALSGVCARRLQHHRAAGRHRRADLARRHRGGEVPGRDQVARADRLLHHEQAALPVGRDLEAAVDAHRLLGEPAEELGRVRRPRSSTRRPTCPSRASSAAPGRRLRSTISLVGAAQDLAALARRVLAPCGLLLVRGGQRRERVLGRRVGDLGDRLPRRRDPRPASVPPPAASHPLAADEQLLRHGLDDCLLARSAPLLPCWACWGRTQEIARGMSIVNLEDQRRDPAG